jgi:hypothetical protein
MSKVTNCDGCASPECEAVSVIPSIALANDSGMGPATFSSGENRPQLTVEDQEVHMGALIKLLGHWGAICRDRFRENPRVSPPRMALFGLRCLLTSSRSGANELSAVGALAASWRLMIWIWQLQ